MVRYRVIYKEMIILELKSLIINNIERNKIIEATLSKPKKNLTDYKKIKVKPIVLKNELIYQFSYILETNTHHKNLTSEEAVFEFERLFEIYKQGLLNTVDFDYQILVNKKGKVKVIENKPSKKMNLDTLEHNRSKKYVIEDGVPCDFLIKLGVMDIDGTVFKNKYDKFKQINKYLEVMESSLKKLDLSKEIRIVDFGSGKAYLTFALYWYLVKRLGVDVQIVGLDLKKNVIELCNNIANELGYKKLSFKLGDIKGYSEFDEVDVVMTLHACNTATDDAIVKAIKWNAKLIMIVPCCQQEIFKQINSKVMAPLMKHGTIKERIAALTTDSLRGQLLEALGYKVDIFEFIETEHTPKNLVIRGSSRGKVNKKAFDEYLEFKNFWDLDPYLEKALSEELSVFN